MAKRKRLQGVISDGEGLCQDVPPWIDRKRGRPAPRLLCILPEGHGGKRHMDARDHRWDVIGKVKGARSARRKHGR